MRVQIAYGKQGLAVDLPDGLNCRVLEPRFIPGFSDPSQALQDALQNPIGTPPLRELIRPGMRVGIIFSDLTRPAPNRIILPAVLEELSHLPTDDIVLFNALGTHRQNTGAELEQMLGEDILGRYRVVQNDAFDPSTQICLGTTSRGHPIWINRELASCDLKILTGFIEPHFFAGFSGGGKAVMPGMAGQQTVLGNHDAGMIAHPQATWGVTQGNPIWEEINEVAHRVEPLFLLNVTLNREKEICGVFAGDLDLAHAAGCAFVKETAMVPVEQPFDIVLTSNSGYPLDLNLYQAVKGMSAASLVVKPGGAIIIAADCWDGLPEHGEYARLLRLAHNPQELLERIVAPGFLMQDQWQAQTQAQILLKADVYLYTQNLTEAQIEAALIRPCRRIEDTLAELLSRYGPQASVCILPEGPQTIPYIQSPK